MPSSKVIAAAVVALLGTAGLQIVENGVPTNLGEWLAFAGKVIGVTFGVGGAGYVKAEQRPAPSALRTIRNLRY